jgi:hypothetical protein
MYADGKKATDVSFQRGTPVMGNAEITLKRRPRIIFGLWVVCDT